MRLKKALGILSKSSPYAVSTVSDEIDVELEAIKKYLYVETEVERGFREKLKIIKPGEIVFLCGSSGDGKSEILTRHREKYENTVQFHLDATHSFGPDVTAIETLDEVFSKFAEADMPLIVGINIGMLGNYEREGSDAHVEIRHAIRSFLEGKPQSGSYTFIDFESFQKFQIVDGRVESEFFSSLLEKIVRDDSSNPFRKCLEYSRSVGKDNQLIANSLLLRDKNVQKVVIDLLFCARIRKDQFITARMLLDFVHCLLTTPGFLFDNLFKGGANELLVAIADFDPSVIRNKTLDLFVIHRSLQFEDEEYSDFLRELVAKFEIGELLPPQSMLRCIYLLKHSELDSNFCASFLDSFQEESLQLYKSMWQLHKDFDGTKEARAKLKSFYNEVVRGSINKYANRNAPYLTKDEFYISSHGGADLAAEVDISISPPTTYDQCLDIAKLELHVKVNDEQLPPVPVSVNLLSMMVDIINGFRPNRHEKNSVVMLDELVNKITQHANESKVLYLHKSGSTLKIKNNTDGDIQVSGI